MDSGSDFSDMDESIFTACNLKPTINLEEIEKNILKYSQEYANIEKRKSTLNEIVTEVFFFYLCLNTKYKFFFLA